MDVGALADQDIAIGALERRASHGAMIAGTPSRVDPSGNALQPGPAVLIGEWFTAVHLLDVGRRVEPVALLENPIEPVCKHQCNRALAGAGHSHHHDDGRLVQGRSSLSFGASGLAQATRWGASRTRLSRRCPLLMALHHEGATDR